MVTAHVDCEVDEWGGVWGWGVGGGGVGNGETSYRLIPADYKALYSLSYARHREGGGTRTIQAKSFVCAE